MKHSTSEIVLKLKHIYGDEYDYSKSKYISLRIPICITCKKHGDFSHPLPTLLNGCGCPQCFSEKKRKAKENDFVNKAKEKFGCYYDYSKVSYVNTLTKVEIICPKHGSFMQLPNVHIQSTCGCPTCAKESFAKKRSKETSDFIEEAKRIWGDKNDYTNTIYERYDKPLEIFCNIHKKTYMAHPYRHLNSGVGCPICSNEGYSKKKRLSQEEFIARCREVHGDEYDYSKTVYNGNRNDVIITCKEHGDFIQNTANHMKGYGCPVCRYVKLSEKKKKSQEQFIADARKVHGDYYDYSLVNYKGCFSKVKIVCPHHGVFKQTPATHIKGSGCPICKKSKGEARVTNWLNQNGIKFISQYKIQNESILCKNNLVIVDFFLPQNNIIIEYNGMQHYKPVKLWGGAKRFERQQERDFALRQYSKENKIKLIEIPFTSFDKIEQILTKKVKNINT